MRNSILAFKKKAQQILGMSFGVIFSILLIIFFIIIAGIVISHFLRVQDCTKTGIFIDNLKKDIDKTWNSQIDSHPFTGNLPGKIEYVCFADLTKSSKGNFKDFFGDFSLYEGREANLFFYPSASACEMPYQNILHIDMEKMVQNQNPFCIGVKSGKISIKVDKSLNNPLVRLS